MKSLLKLILQYYLKYVTKIVLFVHRPKIIAVSGSINKPFFKEAVGKILKKTGLRVGISENSFNTEIGLPLAVLNLPSGYNSYRNWWPVIRGALKAVFKTNFPQVLVLELGVSNPGDIKYLLSIIKPDISIVTNITQRYIERFADMDQLVGEYETLARGNKKGGMVLLNADNERTKRISQKVKTGQAVLFGKAEGSDWQITQVEKMESGQRVVVRHGDMDFSQAINRFGEHHAYAYAASLAIKNIMKLD